MNFKTLISILVQRVKPLLVMLASAIGVLVQVSDALLLVQFPANAPGRQRMMAQVLGPLPSV